MGGFTRNPQRPLDKTGDTRRPPGLRPHAGPLPRLWLPAASRSSAAFTLLLHHPPPPRHTAQYLLSLTPLSSRPVLPAVPGLHREPPAAPAAPETCVPCSATPSPRLRLFSRLSFLLSPPPPAPHPSRAPASKRGQPRNQRRRLQEGQLETALKRLNFFFLKFILELN